MVAYSAYQPPPSNAASAAGSYTVAAAPVATVAYPPATVTTYSQYPPQPAGAPAMASTAQVYDPNKSYYPQPAPASNLVAVTYAADPHYQSRPVYSSNSAAAAAAAAQSAARPAIITGQPRPSYTTYSHTNSTPSYSYGAPPAMSAAVVASSAPKPNLYAQHAQHPPPVGPVGPVPGVGRAGGHQRRSKPQQQPQQWSGGRDRKGGGGGGGPNSQNQGHPQHQQQQRPSFKSRPPPKQQQLHYCEVCKISCAGPQTYKEHLEGQKHKKKEAALKTGAPGPTTRGGNALRCELCDVTCTGSDAYAAHIRGAKHQKVVKLHTKLGKPIPSAFPVMVTKGGEQQVEGADGAGDIVGAPIPTTMNANPIQTIVQKQAQVYGPSKQQQQQQPQQPAAPVIPKIKFVAAGQTPDVKTEGGGKSSSNGSQAAPSASSASGSEVTIPRLPEEKDVQPVGHDYIEEMKNAEGKVVSFNCKLCECRFNDPNAKEMHMKGRRHRLQYKRKVNPDLVVDVKPSLKQRKMAEERAKRTQAREDFWKRREEEFRMMEEEEKSFWDERRKFEEEQQHGRFHRGGMPMPYGPGPRFGMPMGGPTHGPMGPLGPMYGYPPMMRRPETIDDRHVIAKHSDVFPGEEELAAVQRIVTNTEKALKLVSEKLIDTDCIKSDDEGGSAAKISKKDPEEKKNVIKAVMRVGVLAKGLMLKGDNRVRLVVLCSKKPTAELQETLQKMLHEQLAAVSATAEDDEAKKYTVTKNPGEGGILVSFPEGSDYFKSVQISLTSPLMRDAGSPHPEGVLKPERCLEALAALRHAKWFQARASGRQSCVMIIRIMRDICQRIPTWEPLPIYALELLVEKVLASAGLPLSPGDALRRVFEAVSGGILLPGSPGFLDPCEKEPQDAAKGLSRQEREEITASAQQCLRFISFRQIHRVLGMDQLPPPKFSRGRFTRKRRRGDETGDDDATGDEKRDKKEGEEGETGDGGGGEGGGDGAKSGGAAAVVAAGGSSGGGGKK